MTTLSSQEREARQSRKPIDSAELPYLRSLGAAVRSARHAAGLTRSELARRMGVSAAWVDRVEAGSRRTRRSTLRLLSTVITNANPSFGEPNALVDVFVRLAGPALAAESPWSDRTTRRRARRAHRKAAAQQGGARGG